MTFYPSYWERSILLKTFDFIVLGAGIIGKQIAIKIKIKHPNARIAIVDRYPLPLGASTRNAGFACFGSITEILDDMRHSSLEEVFSLADKRRRGIQQLINEFGTEKIGFRPTGSYEIFDKANINDLDEALNQIDFINEELRYRTGLQGVFEIKNKLTLGMNCIDTVFFNSHEGMLNSGMLNETIASKAHNMDIIPFYGFDVKHIEETAKGYELSNDQGMKINCNQLIVANNAFASQLFPELNVVPARGQIIITKPIDMIPFDGIFHSDKGYIYFRTIDNRILIGGARNHFKQDEETYEFKGSDEIKNYLESYLRTIVIPNHSFEIDMHWSGIMAMGDKKLPIVERRNDHLLLCVRMSGMGVALGPILSDEITAMV